MRTRQVIRHSMVTYKIKIFWTYLVPLFLHRSLDSSLTCLCSYLSAWCYSKLQLVLLYFLSQHQRCKYQWSSVNYLIFPLHLFNTILMAAEFPGRKPKMPDCAASRTSPYIFPCHNVNGKTHRKKSGRWEVHWKEK